MFNLIIEIKGTSLIAVPPKVNNDIIAETKATYDSRYGLYKLPCDTKFEWSIYLGKQKLTINEKVGIFSYEETCYLTFDEYDSFEDPQIILGMPVIREFCQVYDLSGRVGFARTLGI